MEIDLIWAGMSFFFIYVFITLHTQSIFLGFFGALQSLCTQVYTIRRTWLAPRYLRGMRHWHMFRKAAALYEAVLARCYQGFIKFVS